MPFCVGEFFGRIEDGDDAPFVAIAALGTTADRFDRGRCRCDFLYLLVQRRLIVLDLDDQRSIGLGRDLERWDFLPADKEILGNPISVGEWLGCPGDDAQAVPQWMLISVEAVHERVNRIRPLVGSTAPIFGAAIADHHWCLSGGLSTASALRFSRRRRMRSAEVNARSPCGLGPGMEYCIPSL